MDGKLKDTKVDLNKSLREIERLNAELEEAKSASSARRDKITELLHGIDLVTETTERIHERIPKAQQGVKDQLLYCDTVATG